MKLYNTQSRKLEILKPFDKDTFKIYACGPTVYDNPTIANLRTFINEDFLRRALLYFDYKVKYVINITDIEDKIIKRSKERGITPKELTKGYEKVFWENVNELNVLKPDKAPHATDPGVIKVMQSIITKLLEKKVAYLSNDGSVYFDISKFEDYGKLSGLNVTGLKPGARVAQDEYDKESAMDFVLWKAKRPGEPSWKAPFGEGRPGWHIECSAMSIMELGEQVDIHAGAVDLVFPHHENEIAQTEAYTGKPFVKYWFHPEHMLINGQRMGKSLGNAYTVRDLIEKFKVEPLALRMLSAQTHYRERLNFTETSIIDAYNALSNLRNDVSKLIAISSNAGKPQEVGPDIEALLVMMQKSFNRALANDLNVPMAMAAMFKGIRELNKISKSQYTESEAKAILEVVFGFDKVLGFGLAKIKAPTVPNMIWAMVEKRTIAKETKDYKLADKLRDDALKEGYVIEDFPDGPRVFKK
jgi:cysteinyl-tRNA synthetase